MSEPRYEVKIPNIMNPFTVEVNGNTYSFPAGTTQEVNQEVYDVIRNIESMVPTPNPRAGEPSFESLRDRPFGESTEVVFDQRVEMLSEELMIEGALPISDGDLVKVTWDGAEYECTAELVEDSIGSIFFGNPVFMGGTSNDVPFGFATGQYAGNARLVIIAPDYVGQSVSIKIEGNVIHPIDPKFLPEMSSYCHVNIWYNENNGGYDLDNYYENIKAAEAAKIPVIGTLTVPNGNVYTLVGCDLAAPSAYLVAFDLCSMPDTLKVFYVWITESNSVFVMASNFSGTKTDV